MNQNLKQKIDHAPRSAGVYLMKDSRGRVLYVGKSKDLKSRISAYFSGTDSRFMIPFLVSHIKDIDFIVTETEKESLILENQLIKRYRPKYNVDFRDDKAYFNIRIDAKATFPKFQLVRKPHRDGAFYFGPYPSSAAAKETLRFLQPIFPLRTCRDTELKNRIRPCMEYQIKRCCGPCVGLIDAEAYGRLVIEGVSFLEGKEKKLLRQLKKKMDTAAAALDFEAAVVLRDRIEAVKKTIEKQIVASHIAKDQDIWGLHDAEARNAVCVLHVRGGKILGKRSFCLETVPLNTEEKISSLIKQYYEENSYIPKWILIPVEPEDMKIIEEWLREKRGGPVKLHVPKRGNQWELLNMAAKNAAQALKSELAVRNDPEEPLRVIKEVLQLEKIPRSMACFDISHISGMYPVASMVTFVDGKPWRKGYRHFKIRTVTGIDDYAMMYEVLKRRLREKDNHFDLLVVDGGRGQLGIALSVLKDLGLIGRDVVGMAKERYESVPRSMAKEEDRFYLPGRKDAVRLTAEPRALGIMQHLRDEAHRFAVTFFRSTKTKTDFHSLLDNIPGVGKKRKITLLRAFGDIEKIQNASLESLCEAEGIGYKQAKIIHDYFMSKKEEV